MHDRPALLRRTAVGAAGGLVGTFALQALMAASKRWLPAATPPIRRNPGEFMVEQAEEALPDPVRRQVPGSVEAAAAQSLGVGYGLTFGAIYAALRSGGGSAVADGAVLGLACWAVGYLGWLPALGLMPPVREQTAPQVLGPVVEHVAYGIAVVAVYNWLTRS